MRKMAIMLFAGMLLLGWQSGTLAALKSAARGEAAADPKAAYNPAEDKADLELPMPGDMKLVLRAVAIPAKGPLDDRRFSMGLLNPDDERGFYEKQFPAYVSSAIRQENMPNAWSGKFPADEKDNYSYYLIGKYELTNGQWDAVMGEASSGRPDLPKTNISWYDLQDFLRKYNEWLLKNHPDAVPAIDNVPAYLRLPTEAEWEFAARGGTLPPEEQEQTDFPMENGRNISDYAIFGDRYDNVMPIGSRLPNNLGIYDMAGNAAELVQTGFRFTISDQIGGSQIRRQHGSEGGLLSKGGNYLAHDESDMYPGKRVEVRMFEKQPDNTYVPHKENGLGARLVLASVNVPGTGRTKDIQKQESSLQTVASVAKNDAPRAPAKAASIPDAPKPKSGAAKDTLVIIDAVGDPVSELEKLYAATESPLMKSNLAQYRELIRGHNEAFNRERDANLLSMVRSAAYKADSLSNIAFRCYQVDYDLERLKRQFPNMPKADEKAMKDEMARNFRNLELSTRLYRQSVREVAEYPKKDVDAKILQLRKEYAGEDQLNKNFRANLDTFAQHLEIARSKGVNAITNAMIWDKVIPGKKSRAVIGNLDKELNSKTGGKVK